jgi:hypothetical protein
VRTKSTLRCSISESTTGSTCVVWIQASSRRFLPLPR